MGNLRLALIVGIALSARIGIAAADPPAPSPSEPAATSQTDPDRVVCRTGPAKTGSRIGGSRECHSQREWDRLQQEQQNQLSKMQIQRGNNSAGP
jgi:hypothetical protein